MVINNHKRPDRRSGLTLLEVLIALVIFGFVMVMAYGGIVNALQHQADQEVIVSSQARLRRIMEVVTQDIRSAVFGSVTNDPYSSSSSSISFMLLAGAAGFPVENATFFPTQSSTIIVADSVAASTLPGSQVVMVNGNGQGVVFTVSSVTDLGNSRYRVNRNSCSNTIDFAGSVQMFEISTIGLRFDTDERVLYQSFEGGSEQPLAFNVDEVRFDYTYRTGAASASEPMIIVDAPFQTGGVPTRQFIDGSGYTYILDRVQMTISANQMSRGREISREFAGYIDLTSNDHFILLEVLPCA